MHRWKSSLFFALTMALSLAQNGAQYVTPEIRRVGDKLGCLCGSCKNTVAQCPMLECHYALPARQKIADMQAKNVPDQAIVDDFVKDRGLMALAVPPTEGFSLMAWVMPFAAIALGLGVIWIWIRRFRKPVAVPDVDPATLDRYHEQIEKDLAKLD